MERLVIYCISSLLKIKQSRILDPNKGSKFVSKENNLAELSRTPNIT